MDFIEKLPEYDGAYTILVIIDRFSKYGHFLAMKHPFTAVQVADVFLDNVFKLHGMPAQL